MSISKGKLTLLSLLISTSLLSSPIYANEPSNQPATGVELSTTKSFPETLKSLINAPGKKDEITIPMPTIYYEEKVKETVTGRWTEKNNELKYIFDNSTITKQDDITLLHLNTNIKESSFSVAETTGSFYYTYIVGNGYVLSSEISTYMDRREKDTSDRVKFLTKTFDKYLVEKGFKKESSMFNSINPVSNKITYTLDDSIVTIKSHTDLFIESFSVVMQNKKIEDNKEIIMQTIKDENMKRDFKSLETILK